MDGPEFSDDIRDHYERAVQEDGRIRTGVAQLELLRVQEIIRRHLPAGPLRILDVGGATGVHAAWLLTDGHRVHLIDPVATQVAQASAALGHHEGFSAAVGDGRDLGGSAATFDAVLLFGPLYHLQERADRLCTWSEAGRLTRPGGVIFGMGITRFASLFDGLSRGYLADPRFRAIVERDLATGRHDNPTGRPEWFTTAYFHRPEALAEEAGAAGLHVREMVGVEGLAAWLPSLGEHWDDIAAEEAIMFAARAVESEAVLAGLSSHLIAVAETPR